jgi:single-strand DNA-binding protein
VILGAIVLALLLFVCARYTGSRAIETEYVSRRFVTVNVVVLAGTVAADPVERTMPSGDEVTELRLSVPEAGKRLLPLPVAVWHKDVGKRVLKPIAKGDDVLVYGQLVRRFYRSGAGARSLTEVVAGGIKKLEQVPAE